jgi:hypothetical protein
VRALPPPRPAGHPGLALCAFCLALARREHTDGAASREAAERTGEEA